MWDFFTAVFQQTGVLGLACVLEAIVIVAVIRLCYKKDLKVDELQKQLLAMSEKRLLDVVEERTKYEELSQDLNKSISLLIQVFKKRSGLNGE